MSASKEKPEFKDFIIDDAVYKTTYTKKFENRVKYEKPNEKLMFAFIPGEIKDIRIKEGDDVEEGQILLVLEAMKMLNEIASPISGKIKKINIERNQKIPKRYLLIEFE